MFSFSINEISKFVSGEVSKACGGCSAVMITSATIAGTFTGAIMGSQYAIATPEDQRLIILAALDLIKNNCTREGEIPFNLRNIYFHCNSLVMEEQVNTAAYKIVTDEIGSAGGAVVKALAGLVVGAAIGGTLSFFGTVAASRTIANGAKSVENVIDSFLETNREDMERGQRKGI